MLRSEREPSITLVTSQKPSDRLPGPCPPNTGRCEPVVPCMPRTGCFPTTPCVPGVGEPRPRPGGPPIPPYPRPPIGELRSGK